MERKRVIERMAQDEERRIVEVVRREDSRLRGFIRRRVPDAADVEDVLQDVYQRLVEANRQVMPIEQVSAWLFRVARNRITDLFRKKRPESLEALAPPEEDDGALTLDDLLPSPDLGPAARHDRALLLEALEEAIDELPDEQRQVFVGHELEGRSFKEMAAATGLNMNTLLARKRYAVLRLRARLAEIYADYSRGEKDS